MRSARSEHILLAVLLVVPLAVAFLAVPALLRWAAGPSPEPTPEVAGATPQPLVAAPTGRPTTGVPPTVASRPTTGATVSTPPTALPPTNAQAPESAPTPGPGSASLNTAAPVVRAEGPTAAVQDFYARVAAHDFNAAASLWSPRMRAAFPPAQNIDQRFSRTRAVIVRRADVVSQTDNNAAVAVELDEAADDGSHHWSGTWQVIRAPDGWLLDQPQLRGG